MTPAAKRQAVAHLQATLGMSERRACTVVGADRTSMRYRSCRADDGDLRSRLCELAQKRRRFGYRRLHILLRRDGVTINRKKGAPQGLSYGQRQSEQMVNKSLSVAAKYIKFRGFVRLDELEVTGSPLVMFHPRSS